MSIYRTSGGPACPRCKNPLTRDTDDEQSCSDGCGVWLSKKLVDQIVGMETVSKSSGNPFRATPLAPTKCLLCKKHLNDLYKGAVDVLTIGQCVEHGIWLERSTRADFEALFAPEKREKAAAKEREERREAELSLLDPDVAKLTVRVEKLEQLVAHLNAEIAALKLRS